MTAPEHDPQTAAHPDPHGHVGTEIEVPHLEADESVPPRPEEEIADAVRSDPGPR